VLIAALVVSIGVSLAPPFMGDTEYHPAMDRSNRVVVVGAGVMGAWTALWLARRGHSVTLLEAYAPGNARSSSGGETRITRSAHGTDDHYPRWQRRALAEWQALEIASGATLFQPTGVLWFAGSNDGFEADAAAVLERLAIPIERLSPSEVAARYPAVATDDLAWALLEPEAGALMARRGVATVADELQRIGGELRIGLAEAPAAAGDRLSGLRLRDGSVLEADAFVFACGPWLPSLVPQVELSVTRQEVLFFGTPPGDDRFDATRLPTWIDYDAAYYGMPSIEGRGLKCAPGAPGPLVDPDAQERVVSTSVIATAREFLARRFPALASQPLVESRVCQYETTADEHFVIDRHAAFENAWVVGGGSGHGFKHGPVIGEYVAALVAGDQALVAELSPPDGRFALRRRTPGHGMRTAAGQPGVRPPSAATNAG
jgi:sarcosine oxidase